MSLSLPFLPFQNAVHHDAMPPPSGLSGMPVEKRENRPRLDVLSVHLRRNAIVS
jgi:hypothetical protein